MSKDRFKLGLAFLTLSNKYFWLVKNTLEEAVKQGNKWMITSDEEITMEDYSEKTKWSDFNIIIPTLFNFYHGIELLLKGFLVFKIDPKPSHGISQLFDKFKDNFSQSCEIINVLEKYICSNSMPEVLKSTLNDNTITIDNLYEFLRYPSAKDFIKIYDYINLKYKDVGGLSFLKDFKNNIDILIRESVKLYRQIEKKQKTF